MTFDEIIAGGEQWLREAVQNQMQESLTLDFKGSASGKPGAMFTADGKLTKEGRSSIGQALSAFSNSAGGVIVIGIDCRRTTDGVDCADMLDPVVNWRSAQSALSSAVGDLLQPKNDSIRIGSIAAAGDEKLGYLLVDVPRSDRRPHRCEAAGQKQYFKRSGSSSYAMEHVDIEDAFRRFSVPELALHWSFARKMTIGLNVQIHLQLELANTGQVSALFPYLSIDIKRNFNIGFPDHVIGVYREGISANHMALGLSDFLIHSGQQRVIERIQFEVKRDAARVPIDIGGNDIGAAEMAIRYTVGAKDLRPKSGLLHFGPREFTSLSDV